MRLLIDVAGLAHRAAHSIVLAAPDGTSTGAVFGVLRGIERLAKKLEPEEIVVCWDGGSDARRALYPAYKANRDTPERREFLVDLRAQDILTRMILQHLPVVQLQEPGVEADDIIGLLCRFLQHEQVCIVTHDHDLYQLTPSCGVFDYQGDRAVLTMPPSHYVPYKALVGDSADNIKGVLGIGDKKARALLEKHDGSLIRIANEAEETSWLGRMRHDEAKEILKRNVKLMMLDGELLTRAQRSRLLSGYKHARLQLELHEDRLRGALMQYGFSQFVSRLSSFTAPFRKLVRMHGNREEATAPRAQTEAVLRRVRRVKRLRRVRALQDRPCAVAAGGVDAGGAADALRDHGEPPRQLRRVRRFSENGDGQESVRAHAERAERAAEAKELMFSLAPVLRTMLRTATGTELLRIRRIVHQIESGEGVTWKGDVLWLRALRDVRMNELPGWMVEDA